MGMTTDGLSYWQAESEGIELLDTTIGDLLDRRANELPTQEAIVYACYPEFGEALAIRWTYQDYRDRANAVAKGLLALGLGRGDHIAIWAANLPEWSLLMMAAAKAGLVLVTINPVLQAAEVEYILKQGDVRALFFMARVRDYDHLATIRSLTTPGTKDGEVTSERNGRLPMLRHVSLMGMPPADLLEQEGWRPTLLREVIVAGAQVSDAQLRTRQASITPSDQAILLYTSGTTGFPKGARLSHYSLVNNAVIVNEWFAPVLEREGLARTDIRTCLTGPFFHVAGFMSLLGALHLGSTACPLLAFDPVKAMQVISRERCTITGGVPTMLMAMLQHPDFASYDLSSLKVVSSGAAPVPVALMEEVKERIGADIAILFGQTEGTFCLTATLPNDPFELKATTVGKPLPYIDIKIIDPATGEVAPVGERGELCYRGFVVMMGYYKMPEKTTEIMDSESWMHSGDLATMNAQGYINIVGRLKDMVIRGGENLFPREIEEVLIRHPKVANAQVVGVPDPFFGEELLAVVIPKAGEQLSEEEVRAYCQGRISHQKIPRYVQCVESYPLTGNGKVQKFVLREQAVKTLGLEEVAKIKTA